ncbi:hypothetical protein EDD16DRAFT_1713468 [Pisolithus croceorrhizus]|nr:hypothetical protein EV401DRAFT_2082283 [Pisolithus croceorrhizus]KAI6106404.1 hypothetical protein EDD16DRAFT_1713468 [Pisolithus croceorrhizus]KAI6165328.1 hypothetical protein EDD17DRAFT_1754549 [Pisolithus thermaeus]
MPPVRSQHMRSQSIPALPYLRPESLQPLPLLSLQMEMVYQQVLCIVVVEEQEMSTVKTQLPVGEGVKLPGGKSPHSNWTPGSSVPLSLRSLKTVSFASTGALPEKERLPSPSPSDSSLTSIDSEDPKANIPKPAGEVGRLGRGGYNLEEHLKWLYEEMHELKRVVHAAVKKYLDMTKSRTFQDLEAVRKARQCFPQLNDYENFWPVLDLIHLRLKYLSSRHRQRHQRETSECPSTK